MSNMTGDDIESALDIIESHGGLGQWEEAQVEETERWLMPRFPGADKWGQCDMLDEVHTDSHQKIEKGKGKCSNWVPDPGNNYMTRKGLGIYESDVETVAGWMAAPRNLIAGVLLLGEPGTGKTALAEAAATFAEATLITHVCTPDDTRDSLFLRFVGEGKGEDGTPYVKGVVPRAVESGAWLYMDEFMLLVDGVKPIFYELSDGRKFLSGGNVDGTALEIHPNFRLIISSNPSVRGASLPEPIGSRFASTTLTVETSHSMLVDLGIAEEVIAAWQALMDQNLFTVQIRELRLANYWLEQNAVEQAVSAFLPEHCPETERKQVRNIVVGMLGGDVREDGRLVVS